MLLMDLARNIGPEFIKESADSSFGRYGDRAFERELCAAIGAWIIQIGNTSGCQVAHYVRYVRLPVTVIAFAYHG